MEHVRSVTATQMLLFFFSFLSHLFVLIAKVFVLNSEETCLLDTRDKSGQACSFQEKGALRDFSFFRNYITGAI